MVSPFSDFILILLAEQADKVKSPIIRTEREGNVFSIKTTLNSSNYRTLISYLYAKNNKLLFFVLQKATVIWDGFILNEKLSKILIFIMKPLSLKLNYFLQFLDINTSALLSPRSDAFFQSIHALSS